MLQNKKDDKIVIASRETTRKKNIYLKISNDT